MLMFDYSYKALVAAAQVVERREEHARLRGLLDALSSQRLEAVLALPSVDCLLALDPPLHTYAASDHEDLSPEEAARAVRDLRRFRSSRPVRAGRALLDVLRLVRNASNHGFKTPTRPRDAEILGCAAPVTFALAAAVMADILRRDP